MAECLRECWEKEMGFERDERVKEDPRRSQSMS